MSPKIIYFILLCMCKINGLHYVNVLFVKAYAVEEERRRESCDMYLETASQLCRVTLILTIENKTIPILFVVLLLLVSTYFSIYKHITPLLVIDRKKKY